MIVATWVPHETAVLQVIHEMGLELQVIFNKDAVMVLPSGVNKATGLAAALDELHLSPHNVVGVGDAENDHAFLSFCEVAAAVDNALPMLKERADIVTTGHHGAGVVELAEQMNDDRPDRARPAGWRGTPSGWARATTAASRRSSPTASTSWSPARPAAASRRSRPGSWSAWRRRATSSSSSTPRGITRRSRTPRCWATPTASRPSRRCSSCSSRPTRTWW